MRALRRLRPATAAAAVVALAAAGALCYQLKYTSGNKVIKWEAGFTAMYTAPAYLGVATNEGFAFRQAVGSWNTVPGSAFRFTVLDGAHAPYGLLPVNDGFNDVQLINLSLGSGVLAATYSLTPFSYDDTTGFCRDIDMDFTTTEAYDFETVALHEQGHVLGLAHTGDTSAVMYAYYTGVLKTLQSDDRNGVKALYPVTTGGGGGGGPPPVPEGLPVVGAVLQDLAISATEVLPGDRVDFSCTIGNGTLQDIFLQALFTEPASAALFPEVVVPKGTNLPVQSTLTITEIPGVYPLRATMAGLDADFAYRAAGQGAATVTVRREEIPVAVGDRLTASLGASGGDRIRTWMGRGTKIDLGIKGDLEAGMYPRLSVADPEGRTLKWKEGKPLTAKKAGFHAISVDNTASGRGKYTLLTGALGVPKVPAAKGAVPAGEAIEVEMAFPARCGGVLTVKGAKKLGLRIAGLVDPDGTPVAVVPGPAVEVPVFGKDGAWKVRVESGAGLAGKCKVSFKGDWVAGKDLTR
jgi:hypothetical protein